MNNILFINNTFSSDLISLCHYEHFRHSNEEIHNPQFTFNQFAHKRLSEIFNERTFELIILPYSLDEDNYLSYTGINVGLHIRLTPSWNHSTTPILFIGAESINEILKLTPYSHLFTTPGIFHSKKRELEDIKKQIEWIDKNKSKITTSEYNTFLRNIILHPPEFYDNRHSIANEWALLLLDSISCHNILKEKPELQEIQSNLYVKWLMVKNGIGIRIPNNNSSKPKFHIPNTEGKRILLIDDEWNKGWLELFRAFFKHGVNNTIVDYIHIEKNSSEKEILSLVNRKLNEKWDLFLLDIRLTDTDHQQEKDYFEYTGFNVLETILESNSGNQVMLMSASNKHQVYNYGLELGASRNFIKPDLESSFTILDLENHLKTSVNKCFDRKYLRILHDKISNINDKISKNEINKKYFNNDLNQQMKGLQHQKLIKQELEIIFSLLNSNQKNKFDHSMLIQFKILENLAEIFFPYVRWEEEPIFWDGKKLEYYDNKNKQWLKSKEKINGKKIHLNRIKSTGNKIHNLANRIRITDSHDDIQLLVESRNNFIHPKERKFNRNLNEKDIMRWISLLGKIICHL